MAAQTKRLLALAQEEVQRTLADLPEALRGPAQSLPLAYDARSLEELEAEGVGDTLGLFVGENRLESGQGSGGLPAQIILYLENLWWESEENETDYRREIRATLLHELGHYLGLDEMDLEERGLG